MFDDKIVMNIFEPLYSNLSEFKECLVYHKEEKEGNVNGLTKPSDCVVDIDEAIPGLFNNSVQKSIKQISYVVNWWWGVQLLRLKNSYILKKQCITLLIVSRRKI